MVECQLKNDNLIGMCDNYIRSSGYEFNQIHIRIYITKTNSIICDWKCFPTLYGSFYYKDTDTQAENHPILLASMQCNAIVSAIGPKVSIYQQILR